mmetsp:Transcript_4043/g.16191  ORF Transcript_4043/g.16191 Transcript_4043/m.16191 type:complete len:166 (+) Transcript_4043:493-990(+)
MPPAAHLAKRTLEEHVYWAIVYSRWIEAPDLVGSTLFNDSRVLKIVAKCVIAPAIKKALHAHGLGRHPRAEIYRRARADLAAVSATLGSSDFFGGAAPCSADATCFAIVANILWSPFASPLRDALRDDDEFAPLRAHLDRVLARAWGADWDKRGYRRSAPPAEAS